MREGKSSIDCPITRHWGSSEKCLSEAPRGFHLGQSGRARLARGVGEGGQKTFGATCGRRLQTRRTSRACGTPLRWACLLLLEIRNGEFAVSTSSHWVEREPQVGGGLYPCWQTRPSGGGGRLRHLRESARDVPASVRQCPASSNGSRGVCRQRSGSDRGAHDVVLRVEKPTREAADDPHRKGAAQLEDLRRGRGTVTTSPLSLPPYPSAGPTATV